MSAFDDPPIRAESAAVFDSTLCDHGPDAAFAQRAPVSLGVVAPIGIDGAEFLKRSATHASNRRNRVDERQQLRYVVGVCADQDCDDGNSVGVYEDVILGVWICAIRGVRASFSPAPTARTDDESTAAYERSNWPVARSLSSNNSCSRSHAPVFCQSSSRRRQVAPEPNPSRVGNWFQRMPVLSTNKMPLSATRSSTRGRPGSLFARGFTTGSKGSISFHSSSSNDRRFHPWTPVVPVPKVNKLPKK